MSGLLGSVTMCNLSIRRGPILLARSVLAFVTFSLLLLAVPVNSYANEAQHEVPEIDWTLLEQGINDRANEVANSRSFFDDDRRPILIVATIDLTSKTTFLDIDHSFGREVGGLDLEDFQDAVDKGISEMTALIPGFKMTMWRIGGRNMDYWFGQSLGRSDSLTPWPDVAAASAAAQPRIVVAAGHGLYFHKKFGWTMQREPANGVLEDEITQQYADQLAMFTVASGAEAIQIRGPRPSGVHAPSKKDWSDLAARYFIEDQHPEMLDVWNSKPGSTGAGKERDQDIRSRPLFANAVGAAAIAHIHTNADIPSARGTRIFVHPGRPADYKMAELSLCSMREVIHASAAFGDYPVPLQPSLSDKKGENSYASVPSMIVEVGFHTNVDDAAALANMDFRKVSMKGVAKGMRLFREGASCEPFAVKAIEPVTAVVGDEVWIPVPLAGNPSYVVNLELKQSSCDGFKCRPRYGTFYNKAESDAYRFRFTCIPGDELAPIDYLVSARDADGVRTPPMTYRIHCLARSA